MPHEIIMPALGMAQETGVIVQWLKAPGDRVAEGEALFEVETDKATMEVEAQAAGWLADVRARAGEEVPVGRVIARIAESPEETGTPPGSGDAAPTAGGDTPAAADDAADGGALTGATRVVMPALGMAQDTGLIVSWARAPGDAVAEDDTLFEVETDKSTVEVPAGASGYVAALLAEAGQEVAVGEVIAVITAERPDAATRARAAAGAGTPPQPAAPPPVEPEPHPATTPVPAPNPGPSPRPDAAPGGGRILASPKARRLAAEAGLDLARLVAAGHPQPYHAADIDTLRSLPAETTPAAAAAAPAAVRQVMAKAPAGPGRDLLAWLQQEHGRQLSPAALWLRFAAAALRRALPADADLDADLVVELALLGAPARRFGNPDRAGLAAEPEAAEGAPDLILRDLSDSAITGLSLAASEAPTLTVLADGEVLAIALDFTAAQLEDAAAIALVTGFADRLNDPLTELL